METERLIYQKNATTEHMENIRALFSFINENNINTDSSIQLKDFPYNAGILQEISRTCNRTLMIYGGNLCVPFIIGVHSCFDKCIYVGIGELPTEIIELQKFYLKEIKENTEIEFLETCAPTQSACFILEKHFFTQYNFNNKNLRIFILSTCFNEDDYYSTPLQIELTTNATFVFSISKQVLNELCGLHSSFIINCLNKELEIDSEVNKECLKDQKSLKMHLNSIIAELKSSSSDDALQEIINLISFALSKKKFSENLGESQLRIENGKGLHYEESPAIKPAIKKSSIGPEALANTRAVKKSCISPDDLLIVHPEIKEPEKPAKFQKVQKNDKLLRNKRTESPQSKLLKLVQMREKFSYKKTKESENTGKKSLEKHNRKEAFFQFSLKIQNATGIMLEGNLKMLENEFRMFLRKNANTKVNSYEFGERPDLCQAFECEEIKYLELLAFIERNSQAVDI